MTRCSVQFETQTPENELPHRRAQVVHAAIRMGFDERDAWGIASAVFEACANAVQYGREGGRGRVRLTMHTHSDRFEAVVQDSGRGFVCPADAPLPPAISHCGRGIPLMRVFMDEVKFECDSGCKVTLVKFLPGGRSRTE